MGKGRRRSSIIRAKALSALVVLAGLGFFFSHYKIVGLDSLRVVPRPTPLWSLQDWIPGRQLPTQHTQLDVPASPGNCVTIGSFNIQAFGQSKLARPDVMRVLGEVARQFDVLAIQEVRSIEQDVMPQFVQIINSDGAQYDFVLGPRLGRTTSKEQYAFVYNTATLELDRGCLETWPDPSDLLHREPFVARFRARGPPQSNEFSFVLVNVHLDPDVAYEELSVLDQVYRFTLARVPGEDDVIILGDFNADDQHLGQLVQIPGMTAAIRGVWTNTRQSQLYDNILFNRLATAEFMGRCGVLDFRELFGLSLQAALEISDHLPVWAQFTVQEAPAGPLAAGDEATKR